MIGLLLVISACSDDNQVEKITPGENVITLSAVTTRSGTINQTNLYLKAFLDQPAPNVYFNDTPITIAGGLEENEEKSVHFPGGTPYYPIADIPILLFGFTEKLYNGDQIVLTAGHGEKYDAVLSNHGVRENPQPGDDDTTNGTEGQATNQAVLLKFRHVMTQLNVDVKIDDSEKPPIDTKPTVLKFKVPGVVGQGYYSIRAAEPDSLNESAAEVATGGTGTYQIQLGTNYLVPTGANLVNQQLTELIIDDYTATTADLQGFTIQAEGSNQDLKLLPGYAYNLTFVINRLKVEKIMLVRTNWKEQAVDSEGSYDPYPLQLNFDGGYDNTGEDKITKLVLHTADKMYIGGPNETLQGSYDFAILPGDGTVSHVELYTSKGLLISAPVAASDYGSGMLNMMISAGGMLLENSSLPNSQTNPYLITTTVQFLNVEKDLNAHYKQIYTVDLKDLNLVSNAQIFNGFGDFTGTYDGNDKMIDALDIDAPGLFKSNAGTLRNIRIYSGTMDASGQSYAGSICGTNTGTIVACFNEAQVAGATGTVGGICGLNESSGEIIACINTGTILKGTNVGGITGENRNTSEGAIRACINTGMLNPEATRMGFMIGTSVASSNQVIRVSFALVGSAMKAFGGEELATGTSNVGEMDVSVLYPEILRNGLLPGDSEDRRIVNRLNVEMALTPWNGIYKYIYDNAATGITWPAPVKE